MSEPYAEVGGNEASASTAGVASPLSRAIGRAVMRMGDYPLRRVVGHRQRERSRKRGGRRFSVTTDDGVKLDAWYAPATNRQGDARSTVLISHGFLEFKERHFGLAQRLNTRGHDVVLYDHRSHGRSAGRHVSFGVRERFDLRSVVSEAIRRELITPPVVTLGFSMGGSTVLEHAAIDERVRAVVACAPFVELRDAVDTFRHRWTPWMNNDWLVRGFEEASAELGFTLDEASAGRAIARVGCPVLLVGAERDPVLPPLRHVARLAEVCAGRDVTFVTIEGATHLSLMRQRYLAFDEALEAFLARFDSA